MFPIFQSRYLVQASFWNWHDNLFKNVKKISDWFMIPNSYLHYIKYRTLILFPGDEIFCKRSVVRDNSLHLTLRSNRPEVFYKKVFIFCKRSVVRNNSLHLILSILISEAAAWKFFSMAAFAKGSSNSYGAYKHFVTWRISLIRYMLNRFKIEFKEWFFSHFFTEISHSCFSIIFIEVYTVMASLKRHK